LSVTPAAELAGILPVVISGGRPRLADRPTAKYLPALAGVTMPPVWMVRDDQAPGYESDGHQIVTYSPAWADGYARDHWTAVRPWAPGAFHGAFPGREQACLLAEESAAWAVWQLDDNLIGAGLFVGYGVSRQFVRDHGGLALFADLLAAVTLSTNAVMCGAAMEAVAPNVKIRARHLARCGFPYSCFLERVGTANREHWYGPTEDDILHAWQYARQGGSATAAIVPPLIYKKRHGRPGASDKTGMRAHYDHARAAGLAWAAPEMARIQVKSSTANGQGQARVFHQMKTGAIARRSPLAITDRPRYAAAVEAVTGYAAEMSELLRADQMRRIRARAAKWNRLDTPPG